MTHRIKQGKCTALCSDHAGIGIHSESKGVLLSVKACKPHFTAVTDSEEIAGKRRLDQFPACKIEALSGISLCLTVDTGEADICIRHAAYAQFGQIKEEMLLSRREGDSTYSAQIAALV